LRTLSLGALTLEEELARATEQARKRGPLRW
jgi:hypothetical protein